MKEESAEVQTKRKDEQHTVTFMIQIYCHGNHKDRNPEKIKDFMCDECKDLSDYAVKRSQMCPYIAKGTKTFCNQCKTPCYKPEYRAKIKKVMRYSGPRIILYMPGKCLRHFALTLKSKMSKNKVQKVQKEAK